MCVSDRVMEGDVYARYDPALSVEVEQEETIEYSEDRRREANTSVRTVAATKDDSVKALVSRKERWGEMLDFNEQERLYDAIMRGVEYTL